MPAGASRLDITPPLGTLMPGLYYERRAELIHDPLCVRAFVLQQDSDSIAVAVCDLLGIERVYLDQAKARVAAALDLPPEHVLICCTHTHTGAQTGDDAYTRFVVDRIADAVRLAWENRCPAEAGWQRASEERAVFNRRYRMKDGTVRTNPGVGNPDVVEPAGPVDPELGVLCLRRPEGGTIGLLANYNLHYVGGG